MSHLQFRIVENNVTPQCRELQVEGELDLAVADELKSALERVASDKVHALIGLQGCEFIDSTGIAVILRARDQLGKEGRRLLVCGLSSQVRRILSVTGLMEDGLVCEDRDSALALLES